MKSIKRKVLSKKNKNNLYNLKSLKKHNKKYSLRKPKQIRGGSRSNSNSNSNSKPLLSSASNSFSGFGFGLDSDEDEDEDEDVFNYINELDKKFIHYSGNQQEILESPINGFNDEGGVYFFSKSVGSKKMYLNIKCNRKVYKRKIKIKTKQDKIMLQVEKRPNSSKKLGRKIPGFSEYKDIYDISLEFSLDLNGIVDKIYPILTDTDRPKKCEKPVLYNYYFDKKFMLENSHILIGEKIYLKPSVVNDTIFYNTNEFFINTNDELRLILDRNPPKYEYDRLVNKVIVFDFDKTLMNEHWHSPINKYISETSINKYNSIDITFNLQRENNLITEDDFNININFLKQIIDKPQLKVVIASYGCLLFIRYALNSILKFDANKIVVITKESYGYDNNTLKYTGNKNKMLKDIGHYYGINIKTNMLFFDDDEKNTDQAKKIINNVHNVKLNEKLDTIDILKSFADIKISETSFSLTSNPIANAAPKLPTSIEAARKIATNLPKLPTSNEIFLSGLRKNDEKLKAKLQDADKEIQERARERVEVEAEAELAEREATADTTINSPYFHGPITKSYANALLSAEGGLTDGVLNTEEATAESVRADILNPRAKASEAASAGPVIKLLDNIPIINHNKTYFDRQYGDLSCGRRALNNLFGREVFKTGSSEDTIIYSNNYQEIPMSLFAICNYTKDALHKTMPDLSMDHYCPKNENYDINVLIYAIYFSGYNCETEANLFSKDGAGKWTINIDDGKKEEMVGIIMNKGGGHWVTLKKNDTNKYEYYDSVKKHVIPYSDIDAFLSNFTEFDNIKNSIIVYKHDSNTVPSEIPTYNVDNDFLKIYLSVERFITIIKELFKIGDQHEPRLRYILNSSMTEHVSNEFIQQYDNAIKWDSPNSVFDIMKANIIDKISPRNIIEFNSMIDSTRASTGSAQYGPYTSETSIHPSTDAAVLPGGLPGGLPGAPSSGEQEQTLQRIVLIPLKKLIKDNKIDTDSLNECSEKLNTALRNRNR